MTANLRSVQEALGSRVGKDIFIYSMTINPEYDTDFMLKSTSLYTSVQRANSP